MKILVLNCGSSSVKFKLFEMQAEQVIVSGLVENIGRDDSQAVMHGCQDVFRLQKPIADHHGALEAMQALLISNGIIESFDRLEGIGHRVVHGGERFSTPVRIDSDVLETIESLSPLAPLHNPANALGIRAMRALAPNTPQVAVFDTAFHHTLPPSAFRYAIPERFYQALSVRRYGFHGTSHAYVAGECAARMGKSPDALNLITLHLGNGASACAIRNGRSIDTSMGFTPLEGLVMGTRSGDTQKHFLGLISTGDQYAVASRGNWSFESAWLWTIKDWIDRRFMQKFNQLPEMKIEHSPQLHGEAEQLTPDPTSVRLR
ncbi:MAG: acetate/propionate family kinase, partial [Campylobacterales bacterium]